jgi:arginine decarboxylase
MRELVSDIETQSYQEIYNDAVQKKKECLSAFKLGILSLEERAKAESLYWKLMKQVFQKAQADDHAPEEILDLKNVMAKQYLCNFSVFQSIIDSWAIKQLVPVVPIQRLNENPTELATLADITCDSDGKINKFIHPNGSCCNLPVHHLEEGKDYMLGFFLTGAYQDIMGDMHNLFGRLNEVHVFCDDDDPTDFYIEESIKGNNAEEILSTLQYNTKSMASMVKSQLDRQIKRGKIRPREGVELTDYYESCLSNYTYLDEFRLQ